MDAIKQWLATNAPKLHEGLNAPAASDEVVASFNLMLADRGGIAIPADLEGLWRVANGSSGNHIFPTQDDSAVFFSVEDAIKAYDDLYGAGTATGEVTGDGKIRMPDEWGLPQWIPIGWLPNGGEFFVDLNPGPEGVAGQLVLNDSEGGYTVVAPSLDCYLSSVADGLVNGSIIVDNEWGALVTKTDD